jgi:hypothetical protein
MMASDKYSILSSRVSLQSAVLAWTPSTHPMQGHLESLGPAATRHSCFGWLFRPLFDWRAPLSVQTLTTPHTLDVKNTEDKTKIDEPAVLFFLSELA